MAHITHLEGPTDGRADMEKTVSWTAHEIRLAQASVALESCAERIGAFPELAEVAAAAALVQERLQSEIRAANAERRTALAQSTGGDTAA